MKIIAKCEANGRLNPCEAVSKVDKGRGGIAQIFQALLLGPLLSRMWSKNLRGMCGHRNR